MFACLCRNLCSLLSENQDVAQQKLFPDCIFLNFSVSIVITHIEKACKDKKILIS